MTFYAFLCSFYAVSMRFLYDSYIDFEPVFLKNMRFSAGITECGGRSPKKSHGRRGDPDPVAAKAGGKRIDVKDQMPVEISHKRAHRTQKTSIETPLSPQRVMFGPVRLLRTLCPFAAIRTAALAASLARSALPACNAYFSRLRNTHNLGVR
jgi:hypothetical protein